MIQPWQRYEEDITVYEGWRKVIVKHFQSSDGRKMLFETTSKIGGNSAGAVALTKDNKVIIAEQFRVGPERVMQDLPAGYVDDGEDPVDAIKRELLEETGYKAGEVEFLGATHEDGYSNTLRNYFFITNCELAGKQMLDDKEEINVKLISIDELRKNSRTGNMTDALCVHYAHDKLKDMEKSI